VLGPTIQPLNSSPELWTAERAVEQHAGLSTNAAQLFAVADNLGDRDTELDSWKAQPRFGGDYRRVHNDFLSSTNATGRFTLPGCSRRMESGDQTTGSSVADFAGAAAGDDSILR
jgi:hypothetical protein